MIQFSKCPVCGERFEQPNVAMLLEPAKTQSLARFGQMLTQHTAKAHPDRFGIIQAATIEFNGFLLMTEFDHTDVEFNQHTRKWGEGVVKRIQHKLGQYSLTTQARITLSEISRRLEGLAIAPQDERIKQHAAIQISLEELREVLERDAPAEAEE